MARPISHRLYAAAPLVAAANSVYLTWLFLHGFFYEADVAPLVNDFSLPFYTLPVVLLTLYTISNIRRKVYWPEKGRCGIFFFLALPLGLFFILMLGASIALLWFHLSKSAEASVKIVVSLLVEIIGIAFAVGAEKMKRISNLVGVIFAWSFSIMGAFTIVGVFEKLHPTVMVSNELRLVFSGIFLHACTSIYLRYVGLRHIRSYKSSARQKTK